MINIGTIHDIFQVIPEIKDHHVLSSPLYNIFDDVITEHFSSYNGGPINMEPFNGMMWPYVSLGNADNYELFGMYLWILYSFFWINRKRYNKVFDIGANIGHDSIVLSKFGYEVHAFEPDNENCEILLKIAKLNKCKNLHLYRKAVTESTGVAEFIRVKGNAQASHIVGVKDSYGETEKIKVETIAFEDIKVKPDLVKFNIEGYEKILIPKIDKKRWKTFDAIIEIHDEESQESLFNYFNDVKVNVFSQKIGWEKATRLEEIPKTHREGHVFVSAKPAMPWH